MHISKILQGFFFSNYVVQALRSSSKIVVVVKDSCRLYSVQYKLWISCKLKAFNNLQTFQIPGLSVRQYLRQSQSVFLASGVNRRFYKAAICTPLRRSIVNTSEIKTTYEVISLPTYVDKFRFSSGVLLKQVINTMNHEYHTEIWQSCKNKLF